MHYQAMKRQGGNLNVYYKLKEAGMHRLDAVMIPTTGHSGKGKTMEIVKKFISGCQGVEKWEGWGKGWIGRVPRMFRAVNIVGRIPSQWVQICPNP